MKFFTSFVWVGGSTLFALLTQFIIAKIIALYLTIADFGLVGQYLSLITIIQLLVGGAFTAAIVKYVSEYSKSSVIVMQEFYNVTVTLIICISFISMIFLLFFASLISKWIFFSNIYEFPIMLLAIAMPVIAYCKFILALSSGFSEIKSYALLVSLISISFLLIFIAIFFYSYTIMAIFVAFPCAYLGVFPIFYFFFKKMKIHYKLGVYRFNLKWEYVKKLIVYAFMPMLTMLLGPIIQIIIRLVVISSAGSLLIIGQWQAINKISDAYTMLICMVFLNYIVPLVSKINKKLELMKVFREHLYKIALMGFVVLIFLMISKRLIIWLLYSSKYLGLSDFIIIQFLGDFFRVLAIFCMYMFIAKAQIKIFIMIEFCITILLLLFTLMGYYYADLIGMLYGYLINSFIFFTLSMLSVYLFLIQYKE